jgi:hypothetical protein
MSSDAGTDDERRALIVQLAIRHSLRLRGVAVPPLRDK